MNDLPRQKLCELMAQHGPSLCDDARRCKALLKEQCGPYKQELRLLIDALTDEVTDELLTAPADEPRPALVARLTKRLRENLDLSEEDARWAVESWALALKVISAPEPTAAPPLVPEPPPTSPQGAPRASAASVDALPSCFYLGHEYDLASRTAQMNKPVMYDSRDLLTHGVVVGMTGSGKTGLCINLLEEAALDGLPCIIIDPKGDLANLMLQFPEMKPEDFLPWLNPDDARQKGLKMEEHARQLAERWRKGLDDSGQTPERIARLKQASDFRIYTPGSEAGLPLSILQTFTAPKGAVSREALNQKIDATTTALLGLTGISSDPVQSREHILIAQLLLQAWSKGRDMDLAQLIGEIQSPSLRKIGTLDVDTFYPEKERLKLAVALNNILASPSFSTWITGDALDLGQMLYKKDKPRQLIFYVAHLDDTQRMFFISLLLEEVLSWTRKQHGTTSLRAILYFDEVCGYLPPHPANPPTKGPLMTLLKQARAFGVGVLLATQNPVDLDYKALSNAGTWFVGKLQTERDKARLLEGLEGVAAERGTLTNRSYLETVISALGNRVFLLHDVHRGQPILFQSRWALSFLRGPVTPDQLDLLMGPVKRAEAAAATPSPAPEAATPTPALAIPLCPQCHAPLSAPGLTTCPACGVALTQPAALAQEQEFKQTLLRNAVTPGTPPPTTMAAPVTHVAPVLAGVTQFYIPLAGPVRPGGPVELVYQPRLLAFAEVVFADKRKGLEFRRAYRRLAVAPPAGQPIDWHHAETFVGTPSESPEPGARWSDVPEALSTAKKLKALEKSHVDFLYGSAKLSLFTNRALNLMGEIGEDVKTFQDRCRAAAIREMSSALESEKLKYIPKFKALNADLPGDEPEPKAGGSWWPDLGLNLFAVTVPQTIRFGTRLSAREQAKLRALEAEWQGRRKELIAKWRRTGEEYSEISLTPRKADVRITHFGLAWVPFWGAGELRPAYR
jgi:hypothetical protein